MENKMRNSVYSLLLVMAFFSSCKGQGVAKINPDAQALNDSAASRIAWGRSDSVTIGLLNKAISLDSACLAAYRNKITALNCMGKRTEALDVFKTLAHRKMLAAKPDLLMGYGMQYAWVNDKKHAREKFAESLAMFEKKFAGTPSVNDAQNMLTLKRILEGGRKAKDYYRQLSAPFDNEGKRQLYDACKSTLEMTEADVEELLSGSDDAH